MKQVVFKERIPGLMTEQVINDEEFNMNVRHMHSEYEIYYLLEGKRYYFIESETILIHPGTLLFIKKETIHKTTSVAGYPHYNRMLIELKQDWMEDFFQRLRVVTIEGFFEKCRVVELDAEGQRLAEQTILAISKEAHDREIGYEQMIRARLIELMLYIIRNKQMGPPIDSSGKQLSAKCCKVNEVAEYIQENCHKKLSLIWLGEHFFVSKCYLSRIFKEVTGFTVNEYLTVQRIKRGRRLLETTDYNITQISEMSGFESVTYFERVFKKQMGQTPFKYRKLRLVKIKE